MTIDDFLAALSAFALPKESRVAVAVSGGGDSMALAVLMAAAGYDVLALTVDHGLREGSRAEAERVADILAQKKIPHRILSWQGDKPSTHIQEKARMARYDLLLSACRAEKISTLAVAHNLEDQVETFWMRLAHGSGLDGLAAMSASREVEGVKIIRPLLDFSRVSLREYCRAAAVEFIDDPSNGDEKFLRVKLRAFENLLAEEGLSPDRLSRTLQKLSRAKDALAWLEEKACSACLNLSSQDATLDVAAWLKYPEDIRQRLLSRAILSQQASDYASGADALQRLSESIAAGQFRGATLGGCIFAAAKEGKIRVSAESPKRRTA